MSADDQFDQETAERAARASVVEPLRLFRASDWEGVAIPERQWLWNGWIPQGHVTGIYADGGSGKSLLAQQLAACVVSGQKFLGEHALKRGPVVALFCEDSKDELHRRMNDILACLGIEYQDLKDFHCVSRYGHDNLLITFNGLDAGQPTALWWELNNAVQDVKPVLVVVDTAADVFGGSEISRSQVRQFIQSNLGAIAKDHDCSVLLVAHPSQAGRNNGTGESGSTSWNNSMRSRAYLERDKASGTTVLTRKKANYSANDVEIFMKWKHGAFVPAGKERGRLADVENTFLRYLDRCNDRGDKVRVNPRSDGYAPKMFAKMGQNAVPRVHFTLDQYLQAMDALRDRKVIRLVTSERDNSSWLERVNG